MRISTTTKWRSGSASRDGCIHIKPSDRDKLESMNLLKAGATIVIRPYTRGTKEYGKPPEE
jgi:hypothetical protein